MRARLTLVTRWFSRTRGRQRRHTGGNDPQNDHRAPLDQRLQRMGPDLLRGGLSPRQSRSLADRERAGDRIDVRGVPGAGHPAPEAPARLDVRAGVLRATPLAGLPARCLVGGGAGEGPRGADHRAVARQHHGRPDPGQRQQPLPLCVRLVRAQRIRLPRPRAAARHGVRRCRRQRRLLHAVSPPAASDRRAGWWRPNRVRASAPTCSAISDATASTTCRSCRPPSAPPSGSPTSIWRTACTPATTRSAASPMTTWCAPASSGCRSSRSTR